MIAVAPSAGAPTPIESSPYTFRPRLSKRRRGGQFVNFLAAASDDARTRMRREVRRWRLHLRPDKTIGDLARIFNPIIQGWINYYGRF